MFGLLGLAARGKPPADVDRLTETVRRLEAGETDVDVSTDRTDAIGDLYRAVGDLAETLREREERRRRSERYRKELYRITSDASLDGEEKIRRLLELGCERLGVSNGLVTRIDEETGRYRVRTAVGDGFVREGAATDVSKTFCRKTIAADDVLGIYDPVEEGLADDPAREEWGIGCYVGGRLEVGGELYGTVCFVDRESRAEPFTHAEKAFVDLVTRWICHEFERRGRDRELRERERDLERHEAFTADVLDALDDVFYVLREDGTIRRWNESLAEATGYADEEIASMHALEFFDETEHEVIRGAIEEALETGSTRVEGTFLTADGRRVPYEFVAAKLEDPDGEPVVAGIGRDISERVARERELERTTDLLEQVQRMADVGGWELDLRTDPPNSNWTEELYRLHDLPPDADLDLETIVECYHPGDRERVRRTIETSLETGTGYDIEARMIAGDGDTRWVRVILEPVREDGEVVAFRGSIQDVTEAKTRERELERTTHLLEQTQRIANVGGWELDLSGEPPYEGSVTDELRRIHEVPADEPFDLERGLEFYHPEDRPRVREAVARAIETGVGYDLEARLISAEGTERWVQTTCEPIEAEGEVVRLLGALQDVTDRKEYELTLASLHDAARDLLATETERDVAELAVETAEAVLDVDGVAAYLLEEERNRLEPVAHSAAFVDREDDPPAVALGDGDSPIWNAYVTGAQTVVDDAGGDDAPLEDDLDGGLLVPMGDHGVFVVASRTPVDEGTRRLVETLVATTEAAFDRVESEASLRERDAQLRAQNRRLTRQVQVTEIIRAVSQSLVGAGSREEIERTVCDRLVEESGVAFAWIGATDVGEAPLVPRAWAGDGGSYLDAISLAGPDDPADPSVTAAATEAAAVVPNVAEGLQDEPWRIAALEHDFHSAVSVPLAYDEYAYGVLTVYADEPDAFGDLERSVFAELGESIADAINAVKTRQALHADALTRLTLGVRGSDAFLERVARETGARVEFEGLPSRSADAARIFFTTDGVDPAVVEGTLDRLVSVADHRLVTDSGEEALFEATVSGPVLAARLVRHGATPRSITATPDGLEAVLDLPTETDVREFVDLFADRYPDVELRSRRTVRRTVHTRGELVTSLFETLTDRQREVLETAYFAGYFEWPRASTGEEVAELLGVSQPAVNRHLRLAQGRLYAQLFDAEPTVAVAA